MWSIFCIQICAYKKTLSKIDAAIVYNWPKTHSCAITMGWTWWRCTKADRLADEIRKKRPHLNKKEIVLFERHRKVEKSMDSLYQAKTRIKPFLAKKKKLILIHFITSISNTLVDLEMRKKLLKTFVCSLNLNQSKSTDYQWNLTDSNS